jgi:endonuclease
MKRFLVVIPKPDGGVEVHAMKQWLRQHPDQVPPGLDATSSTSHQLRGALKRSGWSIDENDSEVRLVPPGTGLAEASVTAVLGGGAEAEDEPEESDPRFGLEYQLRDFLAQNIQSIDVDGKRLRLFVDPAGRDGIEYPTAVGPIDLLAVDDAGAFFVFELKRARSPDHAMGQVTRYMGWVRQTIGRDRDVNGVIVAKEISDALRYAVSVVPNVSLFEYQVEFTLRPAHEIAP